MKKPAVAAAVKPVVDKLLSPEIWDTVASKLQGTALSWWKVHKDDLIDMAQEEAHEIFEALARGDTFTAKLEIVGNMTRKEWVAYRRATSAELSGVAARRHRLLRAIETIAIATAKTIGQVVTSAF